MEQHDDNKEAFKKLMPILTSLDEEETEIFLHMIRNKGRQESAAAQRSNDLIDQACSDDMKERLAKLSEEANYAMKNTYLHNEQTMKYAKKERMPIDHTKVRDLLRNQHIARFAIDD